MQHFETVLLAGVAPALVMLIYATLKLRGGLFSPVTWIAILCGTGVCFPAIGLEMAGGTLRHLIDLGPVASRAVLFFGIVGPAEEGAKLVLILALVELSGTRPARRALLAAVGVGIGFALLENLTYLVRARDVVGLAVMRANTAIPAHLLFAMVMGPMVVRSRLYPRHRGALLAIGFALAASLHGAYDFLLSNPFDDAVASRRLIQLGGVLAIAMFNAALPLAHASDDDGGAPWPDPPRVACFLAGLLALPWPILMLFVAIASHQPEARLIAVFPALIVLDLIRSAFVRAKPTEGHRLLLRF